MLELFRAWIDRLHDFSMRRGLPWIGWAARAIELTIEIGRQLVSPQALRAAASLAFTTVLSMVPLLAVSFAVFKAFVPSTEAAAKVRGWLLGTLLADSVQDVVAVIEQFLDEARGGAVGLVGTIFLLGTALSLFMSIERAFNDIWHVPMSRPLHRRLTTFYAVITLTPALIGVGSVFAEKLKSQLDTWSFGLSIGAGAVSFALTVLGLTLMYKLLPHTHVKWKVATAGGVWAAVTLQIGRSLFNYYAGSIYSGSVQSKIYGAFSLIPVFFLWVYLTWALVLGGNILAYMVQNRESLTRALLRRRRRQSGAPAPPNGYLVTRVFFLIARHFRRRGGGLDPATLAADLQIEADEVVPALRLLREGGLVLEVVGNGGELVPARPLDDIRLAEFYALCDDDGYAPGELPVRGFETVEACLTQAEAARDASLQVTVEALLDEAGVGRAPVSTPPEPVIDD